MTKLTWVSGLIITAIGVVSWILGWYLNTVTGEPANADIGAGILLLVGMPIAALGFLLVAAGAISAGVKRFRDRRARA